MFVTKRLVQLAVLLITIHFCDAFSYSRFHKLPIKSRLNRLYDENGNVGAVEGDFSTQFDESELVSEEISRLRESINKVYEQVARVQEQLEEEKQILKEADEKYGPDIARLKEEFADLRERTFAESAKASEKAVCDALKEVLPVADNFMRIKQAYTPLHDESELAIFTAYSEICDSFNKVIEEFGVSKVESLGMPYDFNFMEAISTMESVEYPANHVCIEYQIGYKMGGKCVRPSFVVVSTGPGPK